jgi:hypothetical protein
MVNAKKQLFVILESSRDFIDLFERIMKVSNIKANDEEIRTLYEKCLKDFFKGLTLDDYRINIEWLDIAWIRLKNRKLYDLDKIYNYFKIYANEFAYEIAEKINK